MSWALGCEWVPECVWVCVCVARTSSATKRRKHKRHVSCYVRREMIFTMPSSRRWRRCSAPHVSSTSASQRRRHSHFTGQKGSGCRWPPHWQPGHFGAALSLTTSCESALRPYIQVPQQHPRTLHVPISHTLSMDVWYVGGCITVGVASGVVYCGSEAVGLPDNKAISVLICMPRPCNLTCPNGCSPGW